MKIDENSMENNENQLKSMKIDEPKPILTAALEPKKRPRGMTDYDGQAVGPGVRGPLPTSGCLRLPHRNVSQGIHVLFQGNRIFLKEFVNFLKEINTRADRITQYAWHKDTSGLERALLRPDVQAELTQVWAHQQRGCGVMRRRSRPRALRVLISCWRCWRL